jgi:hypothetical protein
LAHDKTFASGAKARVPRSSIGTAEAVPSPSRAFTKPVPNKQQQEQQPKSNSQRATAKEQQQQQERATARKSKINNSVNSNFNWADKSVRPTRAKFIAFYPFYRPGM